MKHKRAQQKQRPAYVRERKIPIQVYVSGPERVALRKLERARKMSASELVRLWIKRALAASHPKQPMAADPRQLSLE